MGLHNSLLCCSSLDPVWRTRLEDHTKMVLLRAPLVAVSAAEHKDVLGFLTPSLLTVAGAGWSPFCAAWARAS